MRSHRRRPQRPRPRPAGHRRGRRRRPARRPFDLDELADRTGVPDRGAALVRGLGRAPAPPRAGAATRRTRRPTSTPCARCCRSSGPACRWRSSWRWPTCSWRRSSGWPRAPSSCSCATSASRCWPGRCRPTSRPSAWRRRCALLVQSVGDAARLQLPPHDPRGRPRLPRRARHEGRAGRPAPGCSGRASSSRAAADLPGDALPPPRPPTSPSARSPTTGPGCSTSTTLVDAVAARARPAAGRRPALAARADRPRKVPPGRRVLTTIRHLGGAVALWALKERKLDRPAKIAGISRRLRVAAEHLGPTYIKLGQIISSGEGIFPEELVDEFKKCRDQVPPEPWPVVERVVEEELGRPHRAPCSPRSSASRWRRRRSPRCTGPRCSTAPTSSSRCSGRRSPTACTRTCGSWRGWRRSSSAASRSPRSANPPALVELFAETITEELDFRLEAENMLDIARAVRRARPARLRRSPARTPTLVTRRMLVMERLEGFKFEDVAGMKAAGVDTDGVVRTGMIGVHGGRHDPRDLPRRPPRREPLRAARRPHRPARLRHHRAAVGGRSGSRSCALLVRRVEQRRHGPARRAPRPRRAARRRRPRRRDRRPRPRPAAGRPDDDDRRRAGRARSSAR